MQSRSVIDRMIEIIERLQRFVGDADYEAFSADEMLIDACVFNLSRLGETANRIDTEYEEAHPEIPWRLIYGLRNRIIHDYEGINLKLIWEIIHDDLPELLQKLQNL